MNTQKLKIICHMMATIDGKITSGVGVDILDAYFDLYTKTEDQLNGNSWMCGRVTMEMFAKGENINLSYNKTVEYTDYLTNLSSNGYFIGIDTQGKLRWDKNKIKLSNYEHELPLIIIVTESTPNAYLVYLQELGINYIIGGKTEIDWITTLQKLVNLGIAKLLLEGGGKINGSLLKEDLIDEISLMIVPVALNRSAAPTIFENQTDIVNPVKFQLVSIEKLDKDCVWLRYHRK